VRPSQRCRVQKQALRLRNASAVGSFLRTGHSGVRPFRRETICPFSSTFLSFSPNCLGQSLLHDMTYLSVILVTESYYHEIRFWEAWSGICSRTISRTGATDGSDCAFSADSAYLATIMVFISNGTHDRHHLLSASLDHTARLLEMASGETVRQYNGHHKGLLI
jgi:hypothetical protein